MKRTRANFMPDHGVVIIDGKIVPEMDQIEKPSLFGRLFGGGPPTGTTETKPPTQWGGYSDTETGITYPGSSGSYSDPDTGVTYDRFGKPWPGQSRPPEEGPREQPAPPPSDGPREGPTEGEGEELPAPGVGVDTTTGTETNGGPDLNVAESPLDAEYIDMDPGIVITASPDTPPTWWLIAGIAALFLFTRK